MIRSWRFWVLLVLLVGPIAAYVAMGLLWLREHGWIYVVAAFGIWTFAGTLFYVLGVRWTKSRTTILPPIDWENPRTFVPFDRQAWALVEEEADRGEAVTMDALTQIDTYIDTGKRLASRLAVHYHPLSADPIEHVPVVQMLTALELAASDLSGLCREVPGGDMVTPSHWKKAVQAAGFFSKANEIYGYLLPLFQPTTGLVRLGAQKFVTGPAWKNMQQNALRWFYRAYVNRLGTHLIELYSGRLAIGTDQYRRLTKKKQGKPTADLEPIPPLRIVVVGSRETNREALVEALELACEEDLSMVKSRLEADGFDASLADMLKDAEWIEGPGYTVHPGTETARDRATRKDALEAAEAADMVLLVIDEQTPDLSPDARFVEAWDQFFQTNATREIPPLIAVVTVASASADMDQVGVATRIGPARVDAVRKALPAGVLEVIAVDLDSDTPALSVGRLVLSLTPLLARAEKVSINRHLREVSAHSKARRLLGQVGKQGKRIFQSIREARKRPGR